MKVEKFNESIVGHLLFDIGILSRKFQTVSEIYNIDNTEKMDSMYYFRKFCIINEGKFNRSSKCGLEQIIEKNYKSIFNNTKYFPCNVEKFLFLSPSLKITKGNVKFQLGVLVNSIDMTHALYFNP